MAHLLAQFPGECIHVHALEQFFDRLRAHHGFKAGGAVLLVKFAVFGFILDDFALFDRGIARLDGHVGLEVKNGFEIAQGNVEQVADAARQSLEEPHVRARRRQLNVAQALAPDLGQGNFHAALVADDSAVLHALVLAAETLPVGDRAKNASAEQAIALRFESAVVDGFGLRHLAVRPAPDFFRRGQADANGVEICNRVSQIKRT